MYRDGDSPQPPHKRLRSARSAGEVVNDADMLVSRDKRKDRVTVQECCVVWATPRHLFQCLNIHLPSGDVVVLDRMQVQGIVAHRSQVVRIVQVRLLDVDEHVLGVADVIVVAARLRSIRHSMLSLTLLLLFECK